MPRYDNNDLFFTVPDGWEDRTIAAFAAPPKEGRAMTPNVVLNRDDAGGTDPSAYADRQLVELGRRLDGFELEHRQEIRLGGLRAVEIVFTWETGSGQLRQRAVFVVVRRRTMLTFTTTALLDDSTEMEPVFQSMLDSVRFFEVGAARRSA